MKSLKMNSNILLFLMILTLALQANSTEFSKSTKYSMRNTATPSHNLITGGQPSINDLKNMAKNGVKVVVNLRTEGEFSGYDEKKVTESLGMKYVSIPIGGGKDFNMGNVKLLDAALGNLASPVVVHCASSNRVGALLALRENQLNHSSIEDAIAFGRKAGMKSTENVVKKLMQ